MYALQINREREKDIERSVRLIERLQVQMQEVRNNMHLSGRKFEEQRTLLSTEKAAIQEQVSDLREKVKVNNPLPAVCREKAQTTERATKQCALQRQLLRWRA